jgi:FKBP-type peptidyl-prolyl cis-trans isomerase (trigger factor)
VDLALRAVATDQKFDATDDDVELEFERIAVRANVKAKRVRSLYEKNDAVGDLKAQIRKSKALEWLVRQVTYVDAEGKSISTDTLLNEGVEIDPTADTGASVNIGGESNTSEESTSTVDSTSPDE